MSHASRILVLGAVLLALAPLAALADQLQIDFEPPVYATGPVHGQDGWSALGSVGSGCARYDVAVVANTYGYPTFGAQSLRDSNARTSSCFGDHTFSRSLADEAGETLAINTNPSGSVTWSGGSRHPYFVAEWQFASTVPGAQQPGLSVVASPDRGDGARMSWVQMADTPGGLDVNFYDYVDTPPFGSPSDPDAGCDGVNDADGFYFTPVATGLDRTVPHAIRVSMELYEGPLNDVVKVWVDGALLHTGTSWEDYFRWCEYSAYGNRHESRTVDSILFRTSGTAQPATLGKGFLIDNMTLFSGRLTLDIDLRPGSVDNQVNTNAKQLVPVAILGTDTFDPCVEADIASLEARSARPTQTKYDCSDIDDDGDDDLTVFFRARDFDKPAPGECDDPDAVFVLTGATQGGSTFSGTDHITFLGPDCK